jgi:hypothetical protein
MDKVYHIIVSAILLVMFNLWTPLYAAIFTTLCIGIAKEIVDKIRGGSFDIKDIAADIAGIILGVITVMILIY